MSAVDRASVIAVVGPTATGKSSLAIAVASRIGGEVINADAMQLYRGMDIGTAKLPPGEWGGIAHHVLDLWEVTETADVARYQQHARSAIDALHAAGKPAVVVGGSGLYVRAALDDMNFPGTDPSIRAHWEEELARLGAPALHQLLLKRDPQAASSILPTNGRRLVRALEVVEMTGSFTAHLAPPTGIYDTTYVGLDMESGFLDARVNERADLMWTSGLLEEVQELEKRGLREGVTARRALGYAQLLRMMDGELSSEEALAATQQTTRRFVRRQRSWFRRDTRISWYDGTDPGLQGHVFADLALM